MKTIQAKDIPDQAMIRSIENRFHALGACTWDIEKDFPDVPKKVVAAKLKILLRRGLIDGCPCGCRGDWNLTEAGEGCAELNGC